MLDVRNLTKTLPNGRRLLDGVTFKVNRGEFVGVLGASGAGKSLTIRCILGLTHADGGDILFTDNKERVYNLCALRRPQMRYARMKMGVIFQGSNLVRRLTAIENVMLGRLARIHPLRSWFYGFTDKEALKALKALERVNMAEYAGRLTGSLSGGEQQRVAIARAINQSPSIYIADEPVSSLDPRNSRSIMNLMAPLAREKAVLGVFHQPDLVAAYCTRMIGIRDGQVVYDGPTRRDQGLLREIYGPELEAVASFVEPYEDDDNSRLARRL